MSTWQRSTARSIEAVILDWAGTTVDFGCLAPVVVFTEVFRRKGVPISLEEARGPMGIPKHSHIREITRMESVRGRWAEVHGRPPDEEDVDAMYADFVPLQLECLSEHAALIPGTLEVVERLSARGIRIGSNSGYSREMMSILQAEGERQGYLPDSTVCASDVPTGRPHPHMCLRNAIDLEVSSVAACIKVDDTLAGVEEGLNAGMWSVGVAISGNEVGMAQADWDALPDQERQRRRARAQARLREAGAHYVVDTIADLVPCVDDIEARLSRGEKP